MKPRVSIFFLALIFLVSVVYCPFPMTQAASGPFLHPVFTDHMVLQRDTVDNIWGWTSAGAKVTVEIGGKTFTGTADSSGKWVVKVGPFAKGGPYQMKVSGSQTVTISDVLFGEVWLCAGQSNMAMQLPNAANGKEEAQKADYPNIRFLTTPYQSANTACDVFGYVSSWQPCNPQTVGNLTAAGYFFARDLHAELDVPVGIICSAVGGSFMESWLGNDAYKEFSAANPGFQPSSPTVFYNGMIAPLIPFTFKGAVWYQGESNTQFNYLYDSQLQIMMKDWRAKFGTGQFPFIIVQLPGYESVQKSPVEEGSWTPIREAELNAVLRDDNNGLVVTTDIGAVDIHPSNKLDLGKRISICALSKYYGRDTVSTGPIFRSVTKEGSKMRIAFDNIGSGLTTGVKTGLEPAKLSDSGTVKGFAIAGSDKKFVWADAVIENGTVLVSSSSVSDPVSVRYAWANNPIGNLYNKEGLPASPFRSDNPVKPITNPTPTSSTVPTPTPTKAYTYRIYGYISPDFSFSQSAASSILNGFKLSLTKSGINLSATTDSSGYFVINSVSWDISGGYTLKITKNGYLCREIKNVNVGGDTKLSSQDSPVVMWAGDIAINGSQDNAINMSDIMSIANCFNSSTGDGKYSKDYDFNLDNAINMTDIMIIAKHFNTSPLSYPYM